MHSSYYRKEIQSARWRKLRNWWLSQHPLCARCKEEYGIDTLAECVHHIIPVDDARNQETQASLMYNVGNLQSLCHYCHHAIHNAEGYHSKQQVKGRKIEQAMAAGEQLFGKKS